jgi:hypothetical protein
MRESYLVSILVLLSANVFAADSAVDETQHWLQDFSLRAADEPSSANKPWEQGASVSYKDVNGKSTTQGDAVLKATFSRLKPLGSEPEDGSISWTIAPGIYLHRLNGDKPQDDRGASIELSGHYIPPRPRLTSPIMDYDFGLSLSDGKKLTAEAGPLAGSYVDVDSDRQVAYGSVYWKPRWGDIATYFFKLAGKAYSDNVRDAQDSTLNGRVSGLMAVGQFSVAPLGNDPTLPANNFAGLGLAPIVSVAAQTEHDTSASGGRTKGNHRLYTAKISFPFTNNDKKGGFVPSVDVSRSIGADLLQSRDYQGQTGIVLSIKY